MNFNSNLPLLRLRYSLGGDRPSQTTNYTLSNNLVLKIFIEME